MKVRRSIMFKNENEISDDKLSSIEQPCEPDRDDPLGPPDQLDSAAIPPGVDRRTFLMRSAVVGATVVITGAQMSCQDRTARATAPAPNVPDEPEIAVFLKPIVWFDKRTDRLLGTSMLLLVTALPTMMI